MHLTPKVCLILTPNALMNWSRFSTANNRYVPTVTYRLDPLSPPPVKLKSSYASNVERMNATLLRLIPLTPWEHWKRCNKLASNASKSTRRSLCASRSMLLVTTVTCSWSSRGCSGQRLPNTQSSSTTGWRQSKRKSPQRWNLLEERWKTYFRQVQMTKKNLYQRKP